MLGHIGHAVQAEVQGTFAAKSNSCRNCDFYRIVLRESGSDFVSSEEIVKLLL